MRLVDVGFDVASSTFAAAVAAREPGIWSTAGIDPEHAGDASGRDGCVDLMAVELLLFEPDVVGVGRCGLDYRDGLPSRDDQRELFAAHIALANTYNRVLVVHTRELSDSFDVLTAEGMPARAVVSPFVGTTDDARRALDLGLHLSFDGRLVSDEHAEIAKIASTCPLDRIVIETGPTAPSVHGHIHPSFLPRVGTALAALCGKSVTEMALITWSNSRELYGLR